MEMDTRIELEPGELFAFPRRFPDDVFEYHGTDDHGCLVFVGKSRPTTFRLDREQFIEMRITPGAAVRVQRSAPEQLEGFVYTDPATFLDPATPGLSGRERNRIWSLRKKRWWAKTVQFFTIKFDQTPKVGLTEKKLAQFISDHGGEAEALGLGRPSASTLRRAIHGCGTPGDRDLSYFLPEPSPRTPIWDPFILQLKSEMIDRFWSPDAPSLEEVRTRFLIQLQEKNEELRRLGADPLTPPDPETMRLWIKVAACYHRWKARFGSRSANRRYRGQSKAIQASRPLEFVMFDHTRVDAWANVLDEHGKIIGQERPWLMLAVDVFSQVPLAAVVTLAPPSLNTVVMCLKQIARPKRFLPSDILKFKNFGDFWGKPSFVIVDRAWENTGSSFQTMCERVGINVIWAPVKTPEFKCHVEHSFERTNAIYWHRLPSGIPHKAEVMSQLGLDPRKKADRTVQEMNDGLWYALRKLAFSVNEGLGMSPARAWQQGFRTHKRPMFSDVAAFDTFLGYVHECQLTTSGIRLNNQRFHDQKITSELLDDLLRYAKASKQRKAPNSTGTVFVQVTRDWTCEYVYVWNPRKRRNVKLPNVLPRFSAVASTDVV